MSWFHQDRSGNSASSLDSTDVPHEKRNLSHVMGINVESPDVVLRESYVSAKDIAVERPLPFRGTPPVNFAMVLPGLYRSGYPKAADYPFMLALKLKTIVTLVGNDLPDGYQQFVEANCIKHEIFDMAGTKKAEIPIETMRSILSVVSNRKNYPLLIHCNQGKHRTGCVVGILRKTSEWDTASIIREYSKYAEPKVRETDVKYITDFKTADIPPAVPKLTRGPYIVRTFYGMVMLASLTISVWVCSGAKLLVITTP